MSIIVHYTHTTSYNRKCYINCLFKTPLIKGALLMSVTRVSIVHRTDRDQRIRACGRCSICADNRTAILKTNEKDTHFKYKRIASSMNRSFVRGHVFCSLELCFGRVQLVFHYTPTERRLTILRGLGRIFLRSPKKCL